MSSIVVAENKGQVHITLNRPEALNALTHEMVLEITRLLRQYASRNDIDSIVFKGAGDRAFCAGGDIKAVYFAGLKNPENTYQYFSDEYLMNWIIHSYPKPIISVCHGFVMGGGYGIAGNGSHLIINDNTRFAMPETSIGFFPDVGIGWKLARLGALGMYIALTGNIFDADCIMAAGLATHKVTVEEVKAILSNDFIDLNNLKITTKPKIQNLNEIESIFSLPSVDAIFQALERSNSEFATATLNILKSRSPVSLLVTFAHLKRSENEDFKTSLTRDLQLACAFFSDMEVYEGIRAQLIDKDRQPSWKYSSIFNISPVNIDYYYKFMDHSAYQLRFLKEIL
jgi:enoyl-CoA hydratase